MNKYDYYLRLLTWAQKRYTAGGYLTTHVGITPTRYTRIESAAARRYLGIEQ